MKKIILSLILACVLSISMYAQKDDLDRYSLPVFEIIDSTFAGIVDDFILNAQKEGYTDSVVFSIYIDITTWDDIIYFNLSLSKQTKNNNNFILYKSPYYYQVFIQYRDFLFRTLIHSSSSKVDYYKLAEFFKLTPNRQIVNLKEPPQNFYSVRSIYAYPYEHTILESKHEYEDKKWYGERLIIDY